MKTDQLFESKRGKMMQIFHQDGIIDLIGGAVLLNFGFDLLNQSPMTSLFTYIPILLLSPMKMQMTIARLGYEPFNNNQKQVRMWITAAAAGMVITLMVLSLVILNESSTLTQTLTATLGANRGNISAGIILIVVFVTAALLMPLKRFLLYAAAALVVGAAAVAFNLPVHIMVFAISVLMMVVGIRMMVKFSRAYPPDKTKSDKKA